MILVCIPELQLQTDSRTYWNDAQLGVGAMFSYWANNSNPSGAAHTLCFMGRAQFNFGYKYTQ